MTRWVRQLIEGIRQGLDELRERLKPSPELVPVPVRPNRDRRRR